MDKLNRLFYIRFTNNTDALLAIRCVCGIVKSGHSKLRGIQPRSHNKIYIPLQIISSMPSIKQLKKQYSNLNKTQQTFVKYVLIIKISTLVLASALFILAWKYVMK